MCCDIQSKKAFILHYLQRIRLDLSLKRSIDAEAIKKVLFPVAEKKHCYDWMFQVCGLFAVYVQIEHASEQL